MPGIGDIFSRFTRALEGDDEALRDIAQGAFRVGRVVLDPVEQAATQRLIEWVTRVQAKAPGKWHPPHVVATCDVVGRAGACTNRAEGRCAVCGRNVCMPHAAISMDADLVCAACCSYARQHAPRFEHPPEDAPPRNPWEDPRASRQQQQPPPKEPIDPAELRAAYKTLGVDPDVSDDDLKRRLRELQVKFHPDRAKSPAAKAKAEERFKKVGLAHDLITKARASA